MASTGNSTAAGTSALFVSSNALPISSAAVPSAAPTSTRRPSETPSPSLTPPSATPIPSSQAPVPSSNAPSSTPIDITSAIPIPSATPTPVPSSSAPPAVSSPPSTRIITAPSAAPSTQIITQIVTPSPTAPGEVPTPSVIVITIVSTPPASNPTGADATSTGPSASTGTADPQTLGDINAGKSSSGLSDGSKTAIAVVVPVVAVALLVLAGIILWRKRKQRKTAEEARRKEVEEYGFNPNHDPMLPAVGMQSEMAEDQSGYRGWGNTTTSSNRKASTTLNSGMAYSDSNSNPGGYTSPGSPTAGGSDAHSADQLMNGRRETLDSEGIGALGAAPVASQNQTGVHRGPSNASSSYSAAGHSDSSDNYPLPMNNPQDYYDSNAYYAPNSYDNNGYGSGGQPIIRDVSARRNTRIENPSVFPQQGNSGIAQNF